MDDITRDAGTPGDADARSDGAPGEPFADCVQCGKPTERPASSRGATLCPVCEWQEGQRTACSG
ncbi:hypothetical protein [Streptomyces sp. H27-D2]|uniref:hypothetical protein n=1 Tax=Streptomyces sp. H27-D2 TaxID=3046304 RepID=UPI002DBB86D2|nr:hypothetical protein [Streptomyces sp. H27-D2]MEC4021055.1 hypothetical protein [Streptomyces sp. H27-D2]